MAKPTTWAVAKALVDAGVFTQEEVNATRRIVIDLDASQVPVMYIERFLDHKILEVLTTLQGIEIRQPQAIPLLGLATTRELLEELDARGRRDDSVDGSHLGAEANRLLATLPTPVLDYKTVGEKQ